MYVNIVSAHPAPLVVTSIIHLCDRGSVTWTPDLGAEATVTVLDVAKSLSIDHTALDTHVNPELVAVVDDSLTCLGMFPSHLELGMN